MQEAFLRIVKYPEKFFSIEPHKRLPYSIIIIRNVVLQMLEKQGRYTFEELPEGILKGVYGLNNREIADVLGITESAVRRRIADAYGRIIYFVRRGER